MIYDPSQLSAISAACDPARKLSMITGGAGSGKTTVVKAIIEKLGQCELMSPTGKAAARMAEVTGKEAMTIHRALCFDGLEWRRSGLFNNPVIIDEASMIDSALMERVLKYKPQKLILVGDDLQLEPVGVGSPFKDLIKLRPDCVSRLKVCHRASGSIHKAGQAIREGRAPLLSDQSDGESFKMINSGSPEQTTAKLLNWIRQGYYNPNNDMILSPRYGTQENDGGIDSLNTEIKKILNPSESKFAVGDRIIIIKNHAGVGESGIWNGDLGFITDINTEGELEISLDRDKENLVWIEKKILGDVKLAYALSVHKAQGSEAQNVFIMCLSNHFFQLTRSLIYTAVTRAKKACVVMGELKAFYAGINRINEKKTVLQYLGKNQ